MKFLMSLLLIFVLIIPNSKAQIFSDIPSDHWVYPYVEDLAAQGILNEDYYFHPDRKLTRAELVKIMVIATSGVIDDQLPETPTFPDVSPTEWYYPYVETAKKNGLVDGYPDGFFRPEKDVIRAEAMKIIVNGLGVPKSFDPKVKFRDYDQSEWYHIYVASAYNNQIITGKLDKKGRKQMLFGPAESITRAEMAKVTSIGIAVSNLY